MSAALTLLEYDGTRTVQTDATGIPLLTPALIVIAGVGSSETVTQANTLVRSLQDVLRSATPEARIVEQSAQHIPPGTFGQYAAPGAFELLVLVCDQTPVSEYHWANDWLAASASNRRVLTVFKAGSHPDKILPKGELLVSNASFWTAEITECIPPILARAGLTLDVQRIFISYRRLETQPLAEQLFDALTHEGFDVFLDRYSIPAGVNFQERLTQELADKEMVLLLESERINESEWTQHEIDFAKRYKLGLCVVSMPDSGQPLKSIEADRRIPLDKSEFEGGPTLKPSGPAPTIAGATAPAPFKQWPALKEDSLKSLVARVRSIHELAMLRRRAEMRSEIRSSLQALPGVTVGTIGNDGILSVTVANSASNKSDSYGLWLTTRPPDFTDFHSTHVRCGNPPGYRAVVVGPMSPVERARQSQLSWISGLCKFPFVDAASIAAAAHKMKQGNF